MGKYPVDGVAPLRGRSASARAAVPRIVAWLACAACLAASAAGCALIKSSNSVASSKAAAATAAAKASSDPGCVRALKAVSRYGPAVVKDRVAAEKTMDKLEIELIVLELDAAADVTGDPAAKQSIENLASAYSRFRDAWTGAAAPSIEAILADTSHLEFICRS